MSEPLWWRDGVIYQVYPRSFADANGDGIGDLQGIRYKLPYLVELGVDVLWISPIYPSPMADFGYDVSDYRGIDPLFGDIETMDALLADAHALGLKVILDFVPNHSSDEHPGSATAAARGAALTATGTSGAIPRPTVVRRTTGYPISAAARGPSTRQRGSTTCTCSSINSPTSTGAILCCARPCTT